MLLTRVLTAAAGIPILVATIWVGGELLVAVVAAAVFVAVLEVAAIRGVARSVEGVGAAALAASLPVAAFYGFDWFAGAIVLAILAPSAALTLSRDPHTGVEGWLWSIAATLYVGVLASHFVLLRELPDGRDWLLFMVLTVWITDTGAYFVGRAIGRHKLAPAISPGKTIEGGIGSAVAGFAAVFGLDAALGLELELVHRIVLGLVLPPVVLVGDLAESALKRSLDVKDSGFLVPGHGGVLDRLDSLLFAAPAVYWYLHWIVL
jgi:phosphatidate cytidylyltransferase